MDVPAKSWARAAAITLLILAAIVSLASLHQGRTSSPVPAAHAADPLQAELRRCQALGQTGASDASCLGAWAENRRRFLAGGSRP